MSGRSGLAVVAGRDVDRPVTATPGRIRRGMVTTGPTWSLDGLSLVIAWPGRARSGPRWFPLVPIDDQREHESGRRWSPDVPRPSSDRREPVSRRRWSVEVPIKSHSETVQARYGSATGLSGPEWPETTLPTSPRCPLPDPLRAYSPRGGRPSGPTRTHFRSWVGTQWPESRTSTDHRSTRIIAAQ